MSGLPRQHYVNAIAAYFATMDAFDMDAFTALLTDAEDGQIARVRYWLGRDLTVAD